ncbi:MAG: T9SS type A sorting domain-containing protein [Bacteroidales bacterium]|nr:T9SS type A sorting domain-containing protein [Bacteroidales bacterium]
MKKFYILTLLISTLLSSGFAQTITILEARQKVGEVVTVKGIVTNGSELGSIRYFQDNTAGIAAYGTAIDNVQRGDSITITGTVKSYRQLLELDPVTSVVINSSGNPLPEPVLITPDQISDTYEGQLIQIKHVVFADGGQTFASKTLYTFTADGETGKVYMNAGVDLVGTTIPSVPVTLTAICSQYDYSNPTGGYQLLPRDNNDLVRESSIYFTKTLDNTAFTKTTLDFEWSTNIAGSTGVFYGSTQSTVTSNIVSGTGDVTDHTASITGLDAGSIVWVQAFSVNGSDTAKSTVTSYATISNSTGDIKVYFNTPVNVSYAKGTDAIYVNDALDDTLINYINRAKYTIDMAIYNLDNSGISNISQALIDATNRGVRVRVVGDGTTTNSGFDAFSGTNVHFIKRPTYISGLMHNKFVIFDAQSANANEPVLWTGSMNFTEEQIDLDANNVIIVQDQSLAKAYQIEFEEMWGSTGDLPDATNAKFGPEKTNNTPHEFIINGERVESYFSPSDGVNTQLVNHINTTNYDLSIATMLLTRDEIAAAIDTAHMDGARVNMLTNVEGNNASTVNALLSASLGSHYVYYGLSGVMHNKYMIVDEGNPLSDPFVWTGSHNWSASANTSNDENTLVVHDATVANLYYQNFVYLYEASSGVITAVQNVSAYQSTELNVFPNPVRNGNINISYTAQKVENTAILRLVDMSGRTVFQRNINLIKGENKLSFNLQNNLKGTYLLWISADNQNQSKVVVFK